MAKTFFTFSFLLITFSIQARQILFNGHIANPSSPYISFSLMENELTLERRVFRASLNADNSFQISCDIGQHNWINFEHGELRIELFAAAQDKEINFSFDALDLQQSIKFTGSNAINNQYLNLFKKKHNWDFDNWVEYKRSGIATRVDPQIKHKAMAYGVDDYFRVLQSDFNFQRTSLHNQADLDRQLFMFLNTAINWHYEVNKIAYFLFNSDRLKPQQLREYWTRFGVMRYIDIGDNNAIRFVAYQNLLSAFIHYLELESPGDPAKRDFAYYRFIQGNLNGKSRYFMLARLMLESFRKAGNPTLAQRKFKSYKLENPFSSYTQSLEELFGNNLEYVPQKQVPDFQAMAENGETVRLSDFAGQVVYISFWASWCGPCLRGFRETEATRLALEQEGVVFLNINLDDGEDIWRKTLARTSIPGRHLFPIEMQALQQEFKISSLPFYILINKQGKLTYLASDNISEATGEFNALLLE